VAALARKHNKPVIAFAGSVADDPRIATVFDHVFAITPPGLPLDEALRDAPQLLANSAAEAMAKILFPMNTPRHAPGYLTKPISCHFPVPFVGACLQAIRNAGHGPPKTSPASRLLQPNQPEAPFKLRDQLK